MLTRENPGTALNLQSRLQEAEAVAAAQAVPRGLPAPEEAAANISEHAHLSDWTSVVHGVHDPECEISYRQQFEHAMAATDLDSPGLINTEHDREAHATLPSGRGSPSMSPVSCCSTPPAQIARFVSPGLLADATTTSSTAVPPSQPQTHSPHSPLTAPLSSSAYWRAASRDPQQTLQCGSPVTTPRHPAADGVSMHENLPPELHPAGCETSRSFDRHAYGTTGSPDNLQESLRPRIHPGGKLASPHVKPGAHPLELQNEAARAELRWTPPAALAAAVCSHRITSSDPRSGGSPEPARDRQQLQHPEDSDAYAMQHSHKYGGGGYHAPREPHALQDSSNMPRHLLPANTAPSTICAHASALFRCWLHLPQFCTFYHV